MGIATIGYERAAQASVIETLKAAGVTLLVDVRALPLSRRKGFSKTALKEGVEAAGIRYLHLRALGTPKAGRDAAKRGDAEGMERSFALQLERPEAQEALALLSALAEEETACLLCYEADPGVCHRSIVAERLGIETVHLSPARER